MSSSSTLQSSTICSTAVPKSKSLLKSNESFPATFALALIEILTTNIAAFAAVIKTIITTRMRIFINPPCRQILSFLSASKTSPHESQRPKRQPNYDQHPSRLCCNAPWKKASRRDQKQLVKLNALFELLTFGPWCCRQALFPAVRDFRFFCEKDFRPQYLVRIGPEDVPMPPCDASLPVIFRRYLERRSKSSGPSTFEPNLPCVIPAMRSLKRRPGRSTGSKTTGRFSQCSTDFDNGKYHRDHSTGRMLK